VERISEQFLLPVLEAVPHQYPFRILGFHSDNGSEYVNYEVAKLLKSLLIEFTESTCQSDARQRVVGRQERSGQPQALAYGHIAAEHAAAVQQFHTMYLNPYLNFHRPCGFATVSLDELGKRKRQREDYATPYEKLRGIEKAERHLKCNVSFVQLDQAARQMTDTAWTRKMATAKAQLLRVARAKHHCEPGRG
jgi:hypothetical protein